MSGRARALLGIPETTFRRKLSKATSQERAGLLTRRPPWNEVGPSIDALVRVAEDGREDVLDTARSVLLQEVTSQIDDPVRGAALMGVGGVMALGCTIGQGISGVSTLAVGSFLAVLAIVLGAVLGVKALERSIATED